MNRELVSQCHDPQISTTQFWNDCPKTKSIAFLRLHTKGRLNNANAHLFRQISTLRQNLIFKIRSERAVGHNCNSIIVLRLIHEV